MDKESTKVLIATAVSIAGGVIGSVITMIVSFDTDIVDIVSSENKNEIEWIVVIGMVCAVLVSGLAAYLKIHK
jgi:hypothetical protein